MTRKTMAVLFGGCSTEYEVSLQSAYAVITNLNPEKYEPIWIGITRQGARLRYYGSPEKIRQDTWMDGGECVPAVISPDRRIHGLLEFRGEQVIATKIDVAFPVLHGKNGEDGTVQGLLTMAGIPFTGCGALSSAMCMDKEIAHKRAVEPAGESAGTGLFVRSTAARPSLLARTAPGCRVRTTG